TEGAAGLSTRVTGGHHQQTRVGVQSEKGSSGLPGVRRQTSPDYAARNSAPGGQSDNPLFRAGDVSSVNTIWAESWNGSPSIGRRSPHDRFVHACSGVAVFSRTRRISVDLSS